MEKSCKSIGQHVYEPCICLTSVFLLISILSVLLLQTKEEELQQTGDRDPERVLLLPPQ